MFLKTKKSLGQNFLINEQILKLIVELGAINNDDEILEIGPGSGNLTTKIVEKKPKKITIIEKDTNLAKILHKKFGSNVNILNQDILKFSYDEYNQKKIIIFGNLPYNISTQILVSWIRIHNLNQYCKKFILLFQKEVADRIISSHNKSSFGRLSILSSWKMNIKKIIDIKPSNFNPSPKVDSTLLVLTPKEEVFPIEKCKNLEHITNVFFNQRRKMIKKPLKILFDDYNSISKKLKLDISLRPQNLSTKTYFRICELYESLLK